jgi:6-phosphogluconolactonase (cycloisomerase 2 family)
MPALNCDVRNFPKEIKAMHSRKSTLFVCLLVVSGLLSTQASLVHGEDSQGAVFVMTNASTGNQIDIFARNEDGSLRTAGTVATGGNGSGGTIDPLHSQGSLRLSADRRFLFAVNAGSGTISSFVVNGTQLSLVNTVASGGSSPTALAQSGDLLYVLNSGGNGNVTGFHVGRDGGLTQIPNSTKGLSGTATSPTSLAFSPNGRFLVVAESATNNLDVFPVERNGELGSITVNPSSGAMPFAAVFAPNGTLMVGNASNSISSYELEWNGTLKLISGELATDGQATCWDVVTPNGRYVYTANAGSSNLSGFLIGRNGTLSPLGNTIVASNPAGSSNLDTTTSADGRFLYTLNAGTGAVGAFAIDQDGSLRSVSGVDGLPASAGLNGIAAF